MGSIGCILLPLHKSRGWRQHATSLFKGIALPPQGIATGHGHNDHTAARAGLVNVQMQALEIFERLRRWVPAIVQATPNQKSALEEVLERLDNFNLTLSSKGATGHRYFGHHVFEAAYMMQCFVYSRLLTNSTSVQKSIHRAVRLGCRPELADAILAELKEEMNATQKQGCFQRKQRYLREMPNKEGSS